MDKYQNLELVHVKSNVAFCMNPPCLHIFVHVYCFVLFCCLCMFYALFDCACILLFH